MKNNENKSDHILNTEKNKKEIYKLKSSWLAKGASFILVFIILLELGFIYFLYTRPKNEIPYVVEIDTATGIQNIKNAISLDSYTYTEQLMINTVRTYIENLRKVSTDVGVNNERIRNVYAYTTSQAQSFVKEYFAQNPPNKRKETERVEVYVYNAMPIHSSSGLKFQVDWNEITYSSTSNRIINETNYRADIDAKQYKPTADSKEINPLGFYITYIYISQIKDGYVIKNNSI